MVRIYGSESIENMIDSDGWRLYPYDSDGWRVHIHMTLMVGGYIHMTLMVGGYIHMTLMVGGYIHMTLMVGGSGLSVWLRIWMRICSCQEIVNMWGEKSTEKWEWQGVHPPSLGYAPVRPIILRSLKIILWNFPHPQIQVMSVSLSLKNKQSISPATHVLITAVEVSIKTGPYHMRKGHNKKNTDHWYEPAKKDHSEDVKNYVLRMNIHKHKIMGGGGKRGGGGG